MPDFQHEIGLKPPKTPYNLDSPSKVCTFALSMRERNGVSLAARRPIAKRERPKLLIEGTEVRRYGGTRIAPTTATQKQNY